MLVDAYLKYKPCNEFAIQIGQFKTPFSIESPINPVNLEIFDYGEAIQGLVGYKDVCGVGSLGRDLGIMATGSLFPIKGDEGIKYHVVEYSLGGFNGNGANEKDNNNRKDVVGRLDIHPGLKALTLSGSLYLGKYTNGINVNCKRNRWATGAQYNDGNLVIRGEYLRGTTGYFNEIIDEGIEQYQLSNGYYAVAGYNFKLGKEGKQTLMPVLRYEHFEPGDRTGELLGTTNYYTAGLNYWPLKSVNCKLDYSLVEKVVGEKSYSHRLVAIVSYKF
jgi:phosphate-selective porin